MSQFAFIQKEWPSVFDAASKAESLALADPRTSCFYARLALETAVTWAYKYDRSLVAPYQNNISSLIHETCFKEAVGEAVFTKAKLIVRLGNSAAHHPLSIPTNDSATAVRELFHFCYWFVRTYTRGVVPSPEQIFDSNKLPKTTPLPKQTQEQLQLLEAANRENEKVLAATQANNAALKAEVEQLQGEVAKAKLLAQAKPDTHDYSEAQTRDYFIDLLLKEAGWALDKQQDREFEVTGMPNTQRKGFVDYVLWGDDGKPLGLVEAKRTKRSPQEGQQQAKLYADCLEQKFGQRPVIFYTNGYEHWMWDDSQHGPRSVQGFYKKGELELLVQRRQSRTKLDETKIDIKIVERFYQSRAIRRIAESFEIKNKRKALLVMATGAGKTRTVIALSDLLIKCNWAKRILFLADRVALVNQAVKEFKKHLPSSSPVNLVTEKDVEGRVFVSTYPTMMGLIDETKDGQRRFGVGHFDLVIVDEAHRSIYQKYGAIFDYFDSYLVGLTATPKEEVDRNTYRLFELEDGMPTDAYALDEAVNDGFLVPPKAVSVPLKIQREGLTYADLSETEKDQWDEIEWEEDGSKPDRVDAQAINKWLFNIDTVDKVLAHLMERGQKVAGGDRLGKTIIFAKNQHHAEFISERFDANYPHLKGHFARIITFKTEYAQNLIDDFCVKDKAPHIAISVDMLDTGIDVPEILNLVFFKLVRSKTKFWQMIGRGTRLCQDLFSPGQHKKFFYVFDYCQNFEFFNQNPEGSEGSIIDSLSKKLFSARLELVGELDSRIGNETDGAVGIVGDPIDDPTTEGGVRISVLTHLHREVGAMKLDNFVIRPYRKIVEKYSKAEAWTTLKEEDRVELSTQVAGLPSELPEEGEEAKRFDLLAFNLELTLLRSEPGFDRLRDKVKEIAGLLEEKTAIPMVNAQMSLILEIQTDEWWENVSVPMLERVRRRIRNLVKFIEKANRTPIYTDFQDEIGEDGVMELDGVGGGVDFEKFRSKARVFLRAHQDHIAIQKLRMNEPLTQSDLAVLEKMLLESGTGQADELVRAKSESHGLGLFVRSLVGLDRVAAKSAFAGFLSEKTFSAQQIEFVDLIVNHLTEHGAMEPAMLYESPFTDLTPTGPNGLFANGEIEKLVRVLHLVRATADAA